MIDIKIQESYHFLYDGTIDDKREIIIKGGRGGGKTMQMVRYMFIKAITEQCVCLCLREFATTNKNSLLQEFKQFIYENNLEVIFKDISFNLAANEKAIKIGATSITFHNNNGKIIFSGINDNTIMSIKSFAHVKYCWVEEANFLSAYSYRILKPTIREDNSKIFYTFNPLNYDDFIYQLSLNPNDRLFVKEINYNDNIYFPSVMEADRLNDYQILPRDLYLHIWEGLPLLYNELQVIDISKIGRFDDKEPQSYQNIILSIDTATSTKTGADYSVIAVLGLTMDCDYYMIHLARGHWDWHTLMNKIVDIYKLTYTITGQNAEYVLVEKKANGDNVIQELERTTSLMVIPITPITDKLSRVVDNFLPFINNFKIPLDTTNPFNFWINDYLAELKAFRADGKHAHDDMIDATSQGINYLSQNTINFDKIIQTFSKFKRDDFE